MLAQRPAKLLAVTTNEEVGMATRNARATWKGNLKEGEGTMALGSGVWEGPFSFKTRFEEGQGTNPEELIGAAEAACFSMQLSATLSEAGHVPDSVETDAKVHIRNIDGAPTISQIDLVTHAKIPGLDDATFQKTAQETREVCIISRALGGVGNITVEATLES
jgi:osmotically inducible protein OsmC